jgi:hypothetical protein
MRRLRGGRGVAAGLMLLACGVPAAADEGGFAPAPAVDVGGSARVGAWSRSRDLDGAGPLATAGLWLRGKATLEPSASVVVDAWAQRRSAGAGADPATDLADGGVRELYLRLRLGERLDVTAGRQTIAWGRADALNPTDVLGRRDYTRLTVDDADQRDGVDAVSARWALDAAWSLQAVWLPRFRGDVIPLAPGPGQRVVHADPARGTGVALKLDRSGAGPVDVSVSYADVPDRMPDLAIGGVDADGLRVVQAHHRARTLGADFSADAGAAVVRGEIAWSRRGGDDGNGDDPQGFFRKRSQVMAVLGADGRLDDTWTAGLQGFGQWVPGHRSPDALADPVASAVARLQAAVNDQPARRQWGMGVRLAGSWRNDTWHAEVTGLRSFTTSASFARAQLRIELDDGWRVALGAERFRGPPGTAFGQLRPNGTAYAELRRLF